MRKIFLLFALAVSISNVVYGQFYLQSDGSKFYFTDRNQNKVKKLGEWEMASFFHETLGFAQVQKGGKDFLLDTLGNTFPLAYKVEDLNPEIKALIVPSFYFYLDSFPSKILEHTQLETLILERDHYSDGVGMLPADIARLKNLKVLSVRNWRLDSLLTKITELKKLTCLDLISTGLSHLPIQVCELENLNSLHLAGNRILTLPPQIGKLVKLNILNLRYNGLAELPNEIRELKNLATLDVANNQFVNCPTQLSKLENLASLDFFNNPLSF